MRLLKFLFFIVFFFQGISAFAQPKSFYAAKKDNTFMIGYSVRQGETIYSIGRAFHVQATSLASINGLTYQTKLVANNTIYVPLGNFNYIRTKPVNMSGLYPLYYVAAQGDDIFSISNFANVTYRNLQEWNQLRDTKVRPGQAFLIGWIMYEEQAIPVPDPSQPTKSNTIVTYEKPVLPVPILDTIKRDTTLKDTTHIVTPEETLYLYQTSNEANATNEKGAAVFFDMPGKSGVFYALHNGTHKGTIIKVYNPGNKKTVYVKVLGPLPETKQYYNSVIGISGNAKEALGANENKAWCEISFFAN